jgi:hypothetical protein
MPSVSLRRVEVEKHDGRSSPLEIYTEFSFVGDVSTNRQMLVDLTLLNAQNEIIHHDWSIQGDNRLLPDSVQGPSGFAMVASKLNSARFKIWHEIAPSVASIKIQFREMSRNDLRHFPPAPHKLDLGITEPDEKGNFNVSFRNPDGLSTDPSKYGVVLRLHVANSEGRKTDNVVKYYDVRRMEPGERYSYALQIDPELYDHSSLSLTFYTKQPDNDAFLRDFFIEGKGAAYKGIWRTDGGELWRIPLEASYGNEISTADQEAPHNGIEGYVLNGLIAHYPFDGNAYDYSGSDTDGSD